MIKDVVLVVGGMLLAFALIAHNSEAAKPKRSPTYGKVTVEIVDERLTRAEEKIKMLEESNKRILRAFQSLGKDAPKEYWEEDDYEPIFGNG